MRITFKQINKINEENETNNSTCFYLRLCLMYMHKNESKEVFHSWFQFSFTFGKTHFITVSENGDQKKWSLRFVKHVQKRTTLLNQPKSTEIKDFSQSNEILFMVSIKKRPCFFKQKKFRCV